MNGLLNFANRVNKGFWDRAQAATVTSEKSAAIYRWGLGIFILLFAPSFYSWIGLVPNTMFVPPVISVANFFPTFPGPSFFKWLDIITLSSLLFFTIGIKARSTALIYFFAKMLGNSFLYSFGKIDHTIFLDTVVLLMAFSGWGKHYAVWPDRASRFDNINRSMALLGVLLSFGLVSAGFEKLLRWVDLDFTTGGFLNWFYGGYFNLGRRLLLAPIIPYLPTWLFEFADYTAVIFELSGFIFLLTSRRNWLIWLLIATLFHFANTLMLNIPFIIHFAVYLVFVDFERYDKLLDYIPSVKFDRSKLVNILSAVLAVLVYTYSLLLFVTGKGVRFFFVTDITVVDLITVIISVFMWPIASSLILAELARLTFPTRFDQLFQQKKGDNASLDFAERPI